MYDLKLTNRFAKSYKKIAKQDHELKINIKKSLKQLEYDPMHPSLHSHKVNSRLYGICWSSRVTGDIRILWIYANETVMLIIILDIGSHSGSKKVYS